MSGSYFETLGRAADAPPDISKTNYLETTIDMSQEVNENIDETEKRNQASYASLIRAYDQMHKRDMAGPKEVTDFLKQFSETYTDVEEFSEYLGDHIELSRRFNINHKPRIHRLEGDPEVDAEIAQHPNRLKVKQETNRAAAEVIAGGDIDTGTYIQDGPNGNFLFEAEVFDSLKGLKDSYAGYREYAEEVGKFFTGEYTDEGAPIFESYNNAQSLELKNKISDQIDAWYAYNNQDLVRGRFGLYKKDFISFMLEKGEARKRDLVEYQQSAIIDSTKERVAEELITKLDSNPQHYVESIQMNVPYFKDRDGIESYALTRKFHTDQVISAISTGKLKRKQVEGIGDSWVQPHGTTDPKDRVQVRDYWKKDFQRMKSALIKREKDELKEETDDYEGLKASVTNTFLEKQDARKSAPTYQELQQDTIQVMDALGIKEYERLPDDIKNARYEGLGDDLELDKYLTEQAGIGISPRPEDIRRFQSDKLRQKWQQYVKSGVGLRKGGEGPGSVQYRNRGIGAALKQKTGETYGDYSEIGTPTYEANRQNAEAEYNDNWARLKEAGASDVAAHDGAMKAVEAGLYKKHPDTGAYLWDTRPAGNFDVPAATQEYITANAIVKDRSLVNQETEFKGEKPHVKDAVKWYQGNGNRPEYYVRLGRRTGIRPDELMRSRLIALGHLKDGELVFPEEENLDPAEQRKLALKPTAGNTYQVAKDNDYVWMLDATQNQESLLNGGYLALKDQNGKWTSIEAVTGQKLNEITYGDLYGLALDGYTHFGMYGITPQGIIDIVESGDVPLNETWDKKDQDLLLLARLRQKTQKNQRFMGAANKYRRLVNIPKEDHEKFLKIAGDLPTWLQLDTLLPEVAKELVKQTTQNE